MRTFTKTILATVLLVLGVMNASAGKADLDPAMFKAWDGFGKDATAVENPENCPNSDGTSSPFGCDYKLYETVGAGACVYGNTNVYYLWYADITGTKTISIEGTAGLQLRFLFNRPAPDGDDPHGGQSVELNVTLDDNGQGTLDVSSMEYVHLNTVKLGWGSPQGVIRKLELDGTVKPVTGWVDMINNGDFEGDDLESFPVSHNGPDNGNTANDRPELVAGAGPDGSRAAKVTSDAAAKETWSTQFYLKFNEYLPEGTQWRIAFDCKASQPAHVTTSAQGVPRVWYAGDILEAFDIPLDWKHFEFSGTVTSGQAQNEGLGSIAFDLNNDKDNAYDFYFDNFEFQIYKESSPISLIKTAYGADVVRVDFGKDTNMQDLVKAAGGDRVVYPNECASVLVNGQETTLMSVEGRPDGYLWIFIDENYPEGDGEDVVAVSFTNPTDADKQIVFRSGKYEGEPVPNFTNILAEYNFDLSENFSYLFGVPTIVSADPEDGGFNLSTDLKEFKLTFDHNVDCKALSAKLDKETLAVTPAEGFAKDIVLTYSGAALSTGVHKLVVSNVKGDKDLGETGTYTLSLSFGPVVIDPNDQPKDLVPASYFEECAGNGIPEGFVVKFGEEMRTSESTYGSGSRMFAFGDGGDFKKGLYYREGYVEYGSTEGHELALEAEKKYNIHFNTARWKSSGEWTLFEILGADDEAVVSQKIQNNPDTNGNTGSAVNGSTSVDYTFIPTASGNYRLRWTAVNADGNGGFYENLIANVQVKYVPNVQGVEETQLVNNALESAKSARTANSDERYSGPAYTALDNKIKEYEGVTFTAPSVCKKAAAELEAATKDMTDHRAICDDYDKLPDQIQTIIDNYAETKFAATEIYAQVKAMAAKYITKAEEGSVQYKELKDDAELKAAIAELKAAIALAVGHGDVARSGKGMFTVGESKIGDWEATCTGVAVLTERIRSGAEALKSLGVSEEDPIIVAANNALSDDDELAEWIQNRIKLELYNQLKNADNTLFQKTVDETTLEETTPAYDMTAFVKNPNIYYKNAPKGYSQESVPGWTVTDFRGISTGWSDLGTEDIPCEAMFSNWGGNFTVYQTVENLPAGVYTVKMGFGERDNEDSAVGSYVYAKTSANVADSLTTDCPVIGQAFPVKNVAIENILVTDGILTIGVQAGASSHAFFNDAQLLLTAPAAGFDYGKAYTDIETGIDADEPRAASVRAIQLFDLNGRSVKSTGKGVFIIRKQMSDGTIRTEKVVVK